MGEKSTTFKNLLPKFVFQKNSTAAPQRARPITVRKTAARRKNRGCSPFFGERGAVYPDAAEEKPDSRADMLSPAFLPRSFPGGGVLSGRRKTTAFSKISLSGSDTSTIRLFTPFTTIILSFFGVMVYYGQSTERIYKAGGKIRKSGKANASKVKGKGAKKENLSKTNTR